MIFLVKIFLTFIVNWSANSDEFECFTYITSTCSNNVVSKWNKDDVGKSLQQWVKSISIKKLHKKTFDFGDENQQDHSKGKHCKTVTITRNDTFSKFDPDLYSSKITILGKVTHDDDGKNWYPTSRTFYGPIWA